MLISFAASSKHELFTSALTNNLDRRVVESIFFLKLALVEKLPYDYVIERTGAVPAQDKPVFENEWYRVYRRQGFKG